jgi:hypothetical protein
LVDMPDLGSGAARRVGSSPIIRTITESCLFVNQVNRIFVGIYSAKKPVLYCILKMKLFKLNI